MMEMVNVSRLANAIRAAGIMRRSLLESLVHARGRAAFGRFEAPSDYDSRRTSGRRRPSATAAATLIALRPNQAGA